MSLSRGTAQDVLDLISTALDCMTDARAILRDGDRLLGDRLVIARDRLDLAIQGAQEAEDYCQRAAEELLSLPGVHVARWEEEQRRIREGIDR